jgi:hypothetical protein
MANNAFLRASRRILGCALKPHGFQCQGSTFWRERNRILHHISLEQSTFEAFTVSVGMQPLFFPFEAFILFGGRLRSFGLTEHEWIKIPKDERKLVEVVQNAADLVIKGVVPWLDHYQTSQDWVEAHLAGEWGGGISATDAPVQKELIAYCALDAGTYNAARQLLEQVCRFWNQLSPSQLTAWNKKSWERATTLLDLLAQSDTDGIQAKLAEYERFTRSALGIW